MSNLPRHFLRYVHGTGQTFTTRPSKAGGLFINPKNPNYRYLEYLEDVTNKRMAARKLVAIKQGFRRNLI